MNTWWKGYCKLGNCGSCCGCSSRSDGFMRIFPVFSQTVFFFFWVRELLQQRSNIVDFLKQVWMNFANDGAFKEEQRILLLWLAFSWAKLNRVKPRTVSTHANDKHCAFANSLNKLHGNPIGLLGMQSGDKKFFQPPLWGLFFFFFNLPYFSELSPKRICKTNLIGAVPSGAWALTGSCTVLQSARKSRLLVSNRWVYL